MVNWRFLASLPSSNRQLLSYEWLSGWKGADYQKCSVCIVYHITHSECTFMWAVLTGRSTGSCFYLAGFSSLSLRLCNFGLHCAVYFYIFLPPEAALAVLAGSNLLKSLFFWSVDGFLRNRSTDWREIVHGGRYMSRTVSKFFWGRSLTGSRKVANFWGHFFANISKTVSRSVTCQLELRISSTRPF